MEKSAQKTLNEKIKIPYFVALLGVVILIISIFLPYLNAVGATAELIELAESMGVDSGITATPSMMSVNEVYTSVYGEDDGTIVNVIVIAFGVLAALTAVFVFLKKPIAVIIFNLIACGAFVFLNWATKEDLVGEDKYAWGIGYYLILIAAIAVFVGAVWMIVAKKSAAAAPAADTTIAE